MKIGWGRSTMMVELDMNKTRSGYVEMRTGFMEELVNNGHKIKILTPFSRETEETYIQLQNGTYKPKENEWDVSWIKKLEYNPTALAEDCDLLIIEASAVNWIYSCAVTNIPQLRRVAEILNSYKGLVIIEHSDPDLPFPFWKMGKMEKNWEIKGNPYRLGNEKGVADLEEWGWATEEEMFKNKQYLVVVKSKDIDRVLTEMDGSRFGYKRLVEEGLIHVAYVGQAYSFKHIGDITFNENPEYDLFYAGFPRNRENSFEDLMMNNEAWLNMAVCGPWKKKKNIPFANRLPYHNITNLGYMKSWYGMLKTINSSRASLYLAAKKGAKMGWETSRPFEACFCGSIVLFDSMIKGVGELFGEDFKLTPANKEKMYKWIVGVSNEERGRAWASQFNNVLVLDKILT